MLYSNPSNQAGEMQITLALTVTVRFAAVAVTGSGLGIKGVGGLIALR